MLSAITTFLVVQALQPGVRSYAMANLGLVAAWFIIAISLFRENRKPGGDKERRRLTSAAARCVSPASGVLKFNDVTPAVGSGPVDVGESVRVGQRAA
jgi:hypothetical protein